MSEGFEGAQSYLPDIWAIHARHYPAKPALNCGRTQLSWKALNDGFNRVANGLRDAGVERGDKVAVVMGNRAETLLIMYGIVKAGACVVPLSLLLTGDQLVSLMRDADATALFADEAGEGLIGDKIGQVERLAPDKKFAVGFEADGWRAYKDLVAKADAAEPDVTWRMEDPFNIIYSSGTTGVPKGIVQSHRARHHWSYSNALEMRFNQTSRALATTSLYSNGTWFMLLPPLFVGATIYAMERFDPAELLATVERERITHVFMVPTQYRLVLDQPDFEQYDLSSLEMMLSAGSSLRPDLKKEIVERMGPGLYELYGASEGLATILRAGQRDKFGSVGTPVLGFDVRIIDDDGNELPWGEPGEIVGYGAGLMDRYNNRPETTEEAIWRDERGRPFFKTGDIGRFDEDGFLYILDRKKDMIISGGFNIFPTDIEQVVSSHPDVADVAVIGIPHDKWGECPLALVIPKDGASPDTDGIQNWANGRLGKAQRIAAIELREAFPRNALGKVLKRELREPYWREVPDA